MFFKFGYIKNLCLWELKKKSIQKKILKLKKMLLEKKVFCVVQIVKKIKKKIINFLFKIE